MHYIDAVAARLEELDPEIGGGRLLGEGCHFFDLMAWVANSKPVSVIGQAIGHSADDVSVVVKFADGCVGTLIYTGLGNPAFPKERLEVLAGGGVAVLDDFRSLTLSGLQGRSRKLRAQDKGHLGLLAHFVDAVSGEAALTITAEDGLMATLCARAALRSLSEAVTVSLR